MVNIKYRPFYANKQQASRPRKILNQNIENVGGVDAPGNL